MHCNYCGMDYSLEDPCRCLPARPEAKENLTKVDVPWGEAAAEWSARPTQAGKLLEMRPRGEQPK